MQAEDFFIPESPKENHEKDISEEELFHNIFSFKQQKQEHFDELNMNKLYFLNNPNIQKAKIKNENQDDKEALNEILLIDDYEAVFNILESNENKQENIDSFYISENLDREDYNMPYFVKNVVSENKCFYPMKNENNELIIKIEDPIKNCKIKEKMTKPKKDKKTKLESSIQTQEEENQKPNKIPEKNKRGPYKKKSKKVEQVNTEDMCFPFTVGKGVLNGLTPVIQLSQSSASIEESSYFNQNEMCEPDQEYCLDDQNKRMEFEDDKKDEKFYLNGLINIPDNVNWWKFTTKKYFITENGKKKRVKKKRKFKPDDIRKKIKARFHKIIKNIINENLKKAGSTELFDFLPQSFIGNVSKRINSFALELTYKEILSTDFGKEIKVDGSHNKVDNSKYLKNLNVLKYLEDNPDVAKRSGFDKIQNMKYKELLKIYFTSSQFENSINQLKAENESSEYIQEYVYRSKTFVKFFTDYENNEEKKDSVYLEIGEDEK